MCTLRTFRTLTYARERFVRKDTNPFDKSLSLSFSFLKTSLERLHEECHWLQTVSWDLCARCNLCPREFVRGTGKCYWHAEVECCHDDCAHYVSLTKKPFVCSRTLRGPKFCPPETWSQVKLIQVSCDQVFIVFNLRRGVESGLVRP